MATTTRQGFQGYSDPMEVVDRTDIDYSRRLAVLQDWLADIGKAGMRDAERAAVEAAIRALETGAVVQSDQAAEATRVGYRPD